MGKERSDGRQQPATPRKRAQPRAGRPAASPDDFAPFATWDGDDFSRIYGAPDDEPDDTRRATVVIPAITLPSVPAAPYPPGDDYGDDYNGDDYSDDDYAGVDIAPPPQPQPRPQPSQRGLIRRDRGGPPDISDPRRRKVAPPATSAVSKKPKVPPGVNVTLVPGSNPTRRGVRAGMRRMSRAMLGPLHVVRLHRKALIILALALILVGVVTNTTALLANGGLANGQWNALAGFGGPAPTPTPIPAPDPTNPSHYVQKYGFDYPTAPRSIGSAEWNRLAFMLPFAYKATAAYDKRYHQGVEPQMLVWWTHAEGISGHISYSNCANNPPRSGYSYFSNIQNCPQASFWQLGFGNQFSVIYVLKNAFTDLHGNPNDPHLVQQVGQWVLDYDRRQGTVPACGGYSCTFPAKTIDEIMAGIDTTTGVQTEDNWWASVLSRDPAINCYMIAHALTFFNHEATRRWIGCYYYEPCWGNESNRLGDILAAWPALRRAAHL